MKELTGREKIVIIILGFVIYLVLLIGIGLGI